MGIGARLTEVLGEPEVWVLLPFTAFFGVVAMLLGYGAGMTFAGQGRWRAVLARILPPLLVFALLLAVLPVSMSFLQVVPLSALGTAFVLLAAGARPPYLEPHREPAGGLRLLGACALYLGVSLTVLTGFLLWRETRVATLASGRVRFIISAETLWTMDEARDYSCRITRDGHTVKKNLCAGFGEPYVHFALRTAEGGKLMALFEQSAPDVILGLYDTETAERWFCESDERGRGHRLLARLQASAPATPLALVSDVPYSRTLSVH